MSLLVGRSTPQTKLSHTLRELAAKKLRPVGDETTALQCERAAADLDQTCVSLGIKGAAVKTTGAYFKAAGVYRHVTGKAYEG